MLYAYMLNRCTLRRARDVRSTVELLSCSVRTPSQRGSACSLSHPTAHHRYAGPPAQSSSALLIERKVKGLGSPSRAAALEQAPDSVALARHGRSDFPAPPDLQHWSQSGKIARYRP